MRHYYCYNENIKKYFYKSIVSHVIICLLLLANDLINFTDGPLEITNSNVCVPIKLGEVRNTKMKEQDLQIQNQKKEEELKNEIEKQVKETKPQEEAEPIIKTPNKPNQLELRNKKPSQTKNKPKPSSDLKQQPSNINSKTNSQIKTPSSGKEEASNSKTQKNAIIMSDISETDETSKRGSIHEIRFKNDVIEYIKAHWNPPDFLLDKDLKITVLIKFNKKGILVHYEIQNYPQTLEYKALVDSIKKLMYTMTIKPLPIAGKKIGSDSIIFTFNPMYN
ncbi:hypothetical protein [Alphaproteobacteria bacterium endosymbiont of Tiliacea citrago]|uniref:hypothetical protein n=1 Tax=Alphaproteobacteria bacterium endosymbiont of Tiliacea citrago TaxID=3077944 RepID=UPI00313EEE1E